MDVFVMQLSGYSSGYTPAVGHAGWFVVDIFSFDPHVPFKRVSDAPLQHWERGEFRVHRSHDAMSAKLHELCIRGTHIRESVVEHLRDGKMQLRYRFDDVIVASWNSFDYAGGPYESVTFNAKSFRYDLP